MGPITMCLRLPWKISSSISGSAAAHALWFVRLRITSGLGGVFPMIYADSENLQRFLRQSLIGAEARVR